MAATERAGRRRERLVQLGWSETVVTDALRYDWRDPYHALLTFGWRGFLAAVLAYYLAVNMLFGLLYLAQPGGVANLPPGAPLGAFFFSVETFATVGYGVMAPQSLYAHVVATVEIFTGLLSTAVITGLIFVRFARPRPRLQFSRNLTIGPYDGVPMLMLRIGNLRSGILVDVEARLSLLVRHVTHEGYEHYQARDLALVRPRGQTMALAWTMMHPIDEASPLFGMTTERLQALDAGFIATLSATDRTLAAPVHAMCDYEPDALLWNHRFADMMTRDDSGRPRVLLSRLDDVLPL